VLTQQPDTVTTTDTADRSRRIGAAADTADWAGRVGATADTADWAGWVGATADTADWAGWVAGAYAADWSWGIGSSSTWHNGFSL